jgi:hypothetical protein
VAVEQEHIESFHLLQTALTQEPVLQYPDFTKPFILTTHASGFAVGAILSQGNIGQDKPIAFASRTFNSAEQNYSTIEKELIAIIWDCRHFRPYLLGRNFTIVTDHKPLVCLVLKTQALDYYVGVFYWKNLIILSSIKQRKNANADALSRNPLVMTVMIALKEKQREILNEIHECPIGGHQGVQRTYERLKLYVTWPGMLHDVEEYITNCRVCQQNKFIGPYIKAPFHETDTEYHPWDKLYLDIVGPLPLT